MYVQVLEGQGHCQFPVNLQSWQSSIPSGKKKACLAGPRVRPGRAAFTEPRGTKRRSKKLSPRLAMAQQNWPVEQETARGSSSPQFITDQIHSTAQSKQKRESECTSFVCRGRRTVEQRKKNKLSLALSAVSWGSLLPSSEGGPAALFSFPAAPLRL